MHSQRKSPAQKGIGVRALCARSKSRLSSSSRRRAPRRPALPTVQAMVAFLLVWFGHKSSTGMIRFVHSVLQLCCFSQAFDIIEFHVIACVTTGRTRAWMSFSPCTGVAIFKAQGLTLFICTPPTNSPSKIYCCCSQWAVSHRWAVAASQTTAVHSNISCRLGSPVVAAKP